MKFRFFFIFMILHSFFAFTSQATNSKLAVEVKRLTEKERLPDISGIARVGNFYVLCSDEKNIVQIIEREKPGVYNHLQNLHLNESKMAVERKEKSERPEFDLEGVASENRYIYLIGSHSQKRLKVNRKKEERRTYNENLQRMETVKKETERRVLIRLFLTESGQVTSQVVKRDLFQTLLKFPHLAQFRRIPGKENGIDIEGLAAWKGQLYIGFRGPLLRGNWIPILVTDFDDSRGFAGVRYVNLGGLGIRGMTVVDGIFFLLGGPVGDGPGGFHLYTWNGKDCLPGKGGPKGKVRYIMEIENKNGLKAEGITLVSKEKGGQYTFMIVFDGPKSGAPIELSINLSSK